MKQLHQHPDGKIFVRADGQVYVDTPAYFTSDFGITLPPLPAGIDERIYDQGVRHTLAGTNIHGAHVTGDVMPWPLGDQAIAVIAAALAKQTARKTPPVSGTLEG